VNPSTPASSSRFNETGNLFSGRKRTRIWLPQRAISKLAPAATITSNRSRKELAHHAKAAGSERKAERQFPVGAPCPRQQKARHIHAGDISTMPTAAIKIQS